MKYPALLSRGMGEVSGVVSRERTPVGGTCPAFLFSGVSGVVS